MKVSVYVCMYVSLYPGVFFLVAARRGGKKSQCVGVGFCVNGREEGGGREGGLEYHLVLADRIDDFPSCCFLLLSVCLFILALVCLCVWMYVCKGKGGRSCASFGI